MEQSLSDPLVNASDPRVQREAQFQDLLLRNMSTIMNEQTRPYYETVRSMPQDSIMAMLSSIIKVMPPSQVETYLRDALKMSETDVSIVMGHVSEVYAALLPPPRSQAP